MIIYRDGDFSVEFADGSNIYIWQYDIKFLFSCIEKNKRGIVTFDRVQEEKRIAIEQIEQLKVIKTIEV